VKLCSPCCQLRVLFFLTQSMIHFHDHLSKYKEFDFGDVMANLLGSGSGLYIAYYMERYYRHRREISRLYRPLSADYISDSEEEDGAQILPSHYIPTNIGAPRSKPNGTHKSIHNNLSDVWDEREELFGIGGDSDDEEVGGTSEDGRIPVAAAPTITVTDADTQS